MNFRNLIFKKKNNDPLYLPNISLLDTRNTKDYIKKHIKRDILLTFYLKKAFLNNHTLFLFIILTFLLTK